MKSEALKSVTVSLSEDQVEQLNEAVASGSYASSSEVVRDAIGLWEQRERHRKAEIRRLKKAYDEGVASGDGYALDADQVLAELKADAGSGD